MSVERIEVGDTVICDFCGDDFTGKPDQGGLIFQSKAACPRCAPRIEEGAARHGEARFIRARCPEGVTFQAFVVAYCGGAANRQIVVRTGDDV